MIRVVVVSPLPSTRAGLRALVASDGQAEVVGEAATLDEAAELLFESLVDVLVVDGQPGLELEDLARLGPGLAGPSLLILGPVGGDEHLSGELAGRVWGYLRREAEPEQLRAALRAVVSGLVAVDRALSARVFGQPRPTAFGAADFEPGELTTREHEVLQLVSLGLPNKAIAHRLGISEHTVKFHVAAILSKLGAGSRTEAAHLGARRGLVVL